MPKTRVQLPDLTEMLSYLYHLFFQCISTLGGIRLLFMFLRPYQVILCSPSGDMVVALKTWCLYLPATGACVRFDSQRVNMRSPSAQENVLSSSIEIVIQHLDILRVPYIHNKVQG